RPGDASDRRSDRPPGPRQAAPARMSALDIGPVATALAAKVSAVADVGPVYEHDIYQRDDLAELIVSVVAGDRVLRAWWITGPRMTSERLTHTSHGYIERHWVWEIHG